MLKSCGSCNEEFEALRATARYCSDTCRKNASRGIVSEASEVNLDELKKIETPRGVEIQHTPPTTPKDMKMEMAEARERLNARLVSKGLPIITDKPELQYFVPTGIKEIDELTKSTDVLGVGGLPRKKMTEIFGPKGVFKSSLVKRILKTNPHLRVLFFDAEGGLTSPPENLQIIKGNIVEDIMSSLIEAVESQEYDLIIVDSIASLITRKHFEDDPEGKASMARAFGPEVKRLLAHLQPLVNGLPDERPGVAVVFINQYRSTTNSFGVMEYTVGGKSMEYYASLRLELRSAKADRIMRDGKYAGKNIRVKVEKTRYGPDGVEFKFPVMFDELQDFNDNYRKRVDALIKGEV